MSRLLNKDVIIGDYYLSRIQCFETTLLGSILLPSVLSILLLCQRHTWMYSTVSKFVEQLLRCSYRRDGGESICFQSSCSSLTFNNFALFRSHRINVVMTSASSWLGLSSVVLSHYLLTDLCGDSQQIPTLLLCFELVLSCTGV